MCKIGQKFYMKTHSNYVLRGGIKMKKNRATPTKVANKSAGIAGLPDDDQHLAQEEADRIFRESVMHLPAEDAQNVEV